MGKRKKSSRKPQGPKKREPLATSFRCLFCNNETSVGVKIDKKAGVGNLICKSCGQNFQTSVTYLSQAVDVYADWVDACDAVKDTEDPEMVAPPSNRSRPPNSSARQGLAPGEKLTEEDARFIEDDEADAEADYAD